MFDTSLCRLIHAPQHIHLNVARRLRRRGVVSLSDSEWAFARTEAEWQERLTVPHHEVRLAAIIGRMARVLALSEAQAEAALEAELAEEGRIVRPIATVLGAVEALQRTGVVPLFLSDTYLTSDQVRALLTTVGYRGPFDVVVSCEERCSKLRGTLFDHVARQRGLDGSSFRHLGDNEQADVVQATAHGWRSSLFAESHTSGRERVLFASGRGDFLASAVAGSARAARLAQSTPVEEGIASAAATVVGPLFGAYVLWLLRDVAARGGRTIFFLARDGQVLESICRTLARWAGIDVEPVYLLASRQAFLLAGLPDDATPPEFLVDEALTAAYYDRITLGGALATLRFPEGDIASIAGESGVGVGTRRVEITSAGLASVRAALLEPDRVERFRERVRAARAATVAYLESQGMYASPEAYIVDLGWRGTTQRRLQRVLGDRVDLVGYYLGMSNTVLPPAARTEVWLTSTRVKTGLLEVMATADHTSVRGFALAPDGDPVPDPPVEEDVDMVAWGAREQQEIAQRFVTNLTDVIELDLYPLDEVQAALQAAALDAYRHFRVSPTPAEAEAYGAVLHSDDVNHIGRRPLAAPVTSVEVLRHVVDGAARAEVTSWYAGSLARSRSHRLPTLITRAIDRSIVVWARVRTKMHGDVARRTARNSLASRIPLGFPGG